MANDPQEPLKPNPPVNSDEIAAIFSGPAVHSNKMFATLTGTGLRIAFMEQYDPAKPPLFRVAAVISYPDAIALRDLLTRQVLLFEKMAADATVAAPGAAAPSNG